MSTIGQINNSLLYLLIFTIISSSLAYHLVVTAYENVFEISKYEELEEAPKKIKDPHENLIKVSSPLPGAAVQSPLKITGQARGNWYFEASFPVHLYDGNGKELAVAPAQAKGEWMTTSFVPFEVTLTFAKPATPSGTLVLRKDNASGLPQFDDHITIPLKFAQ